MDSVFLIGDFNAKNCDFNREFDNISDRVILDNICNKHEILNDSKLCVLHGIFGDKYTRGKAVVDYVCVPHDTLENCSDLKILPCNSIIIESDNLQEYLAAQSKVPDNAFLLFVIILEQG